MGAVTCRTAVPDTPLIAAVIVAEPCPFVLAIPPLLMVAIDVADEVHDTELVRSWVVLLLKVPFAVNDCDRPRATEAAPGDTWIAVSVTWLLELELELHPASRPNARKTTRTEILFTADLDPVTP